MKNGVIDSPRTGDQTPGKGSHTGGKGVYNGEPGLPKRSSTKTGPPEKVREGGPFTPKGPAKQSY